MSAARTHDIVNALTSATVVTFDQAAPDTPTSCAAICAGRSS
jgi:hypothetical protein